MALSEQQSAQLSAQLSADAEAMGLTTSSAPTPTESANSIASSDDSNDRFDPSVAWAGIGADLNTWLTDSETNTFSSSDKTNSTTLEEDESSDHSHSHDSRYGHFYGPHGRNTESSHSGTRLSPNLSGYTGGSRSHGTSQRRGRASTVSTQSILIKETLNRFANNFTDTIETVSSTLSHTSIMLISDPGKAGDHEYGPQGGL